MPSRSLESLESRLMMASNIRSYDGTDNNLLNPFYGVAGADFVRLTPSAYGDGISTPAGASRPSARAVSNAVAAHPADEMPSGNHLSAFVYVWGQFIDHDLDLTNSASPAEAFNIAIPTGDPYFDPSATGTQVMPLTRSIYDPATGKTTPRQQVNAITSFIDGSMVYGSDAPTNASLRTFTGGKLKTSAGNLLPTDATGFFFAGDVRVDENPDLIAIQTLFLREHNRIASKIAAKNPTWTDEQIFQGARRIVIGEIQQITYNEFLPALLGRGAIKPYAGYNPSVNTSVSTEFATAAFRLGHSMLADDIEFMDNNGNATRAPMSLAESFFNPAVVQQNGIDPILKYVSSSNAEEIDTKIVDSLRNMLFGPPGAGGLDLASLNIQRGRDHGLSDYNSTRAALGLPKVTSFNQITSDATLAAQLKSVYGSVDNVDLWVGGLAENHLPGSNVGPTFQRILVDQFTRARDGDRFYFERDLNPAELQMVRNTRLSNIIAMNSTTTNLQDNVFIFDVSLAGRVWMDGNANARPDLGELGLGGIKVQLIDGEGDIIDTATTNREGGYVLDTGGELGNYTVKALLPTGLRFTTASVRTFAATKGMQFDHVDFGVRSTQPPPQQPPTQQPPPPPRMQLAGAPAPHRELLNLLQ